MRLINADELEPVITQWNPGALREESYYHEEQIINAPTIDAIPVKWIKKWIKDCEYTDDIQIICARGPIRKMIAEWRKENELSNFHCRKY